MEGKEDMIKNKSRIQIIDFTPNKVQEPDEIDINNFAKYLRSPSITWINVTGVRDISLINQIGMQFDLHPLTIGDIANTNQRPKLEEFNHYMFAILKMVYFNETHNSLTMEQLSIIMTKNVVISFQEKPGDVFEKIRENIRSGKNRIRKSGGDYLTYALIDAIVDNYFSVLEGIGEELDNLEERLLKNPTPKTLHSIHSLKRKLLNLRRSIWPVRDSINALLRSESRIITKPTLPYLRDLSDKTIRVIESVELHNDLIAGLLDIYFSNISNRTNDTMKVLTIIATIFIPLTFITGIYGMNFDNMPELMWEYGYFIIVGLMTFLGIAMFFFFKKKKWV